MKKFAIRCIASLCVAAGSLVVALPAQAAILGTIACTQSFDTTIGNLPFYQDCRGPSEGTLDGNAAEVAKIIARFADDPSNPRLDSLVYRGKSNDLSGSPFGLNGPFSEDPAGRSSGILKFDDLLRGVFVVGFQGGFASTPGASSIPNYSYYLFDSDPSRTGTLGIGMLNFDTDGIVRSDNLSRGGPLAFAALYTLGSPAGGTIPEPAGIALATVAFGALVLTTRRRRG